MATDGWWDVSAVNRNQYRFALGKVALVGGVSALLLVVVVVRLVETGGSSGSTVVEGVFILLLVAIVAVLFRGSLKTPLVAIRVDRLRVIGRVEGGKEIDLGRLDGPSPTSLGLLARNPGQDVVGANAPMFYLVTATGGLSYPLPFDVGNRLIEYATASGLKVSSEPFSLRRGIPPTELFRFSVASPGTTG